MKHKILHQAIIAALAAGPAVALADIEVSGHVKNESAWVTNNKQFIGEERTRDDKSSHHGDTLKVESSARMFVNGYIGEESSWHLDLNLIYDSEGVENEYKGHKSYTQHDWLREAYIDTKFGSTDARIGKQQVVWGTADGIKLLDIINPTDYREFSQNTMESSRIPIWMVNLDTPVGDTGSFQMILAESEENKIPGLDADGDEGHGFTMRGVDTITGSVNGFMGAAPALAGVATTFTGFAKNFNVVLPQWNTATVDGFANNTGAAAGFGGACQTANSGYTGSNQAAGASSGCLSHIAENVTGFGGANNNVTNLLDSQSDQAAAGASQEWDITNPNSGFEFMPNATFATFNTFAGNTNHGGGHGALVTNYVRDYSDSDDPNFGFRFKDSTESGVNWSLNYFYNYDPNPVVDVSLRDASTGEELTTEYWQGANGAATTAGTQISKDQALAADTAANPVTILLKNSAGQYYGAFDPDTAGNSTRVTADANFSGNGVELRFTETMERTHNIGGSFDMALDNFAVPVVLRGEFLYKKDEMHPVIDRKLLSIGDFEGALKPEEHDMFKYVLGVDITVLTNMLVSTQFIQFRNLDYVDQGRNCTSQAGTAYNCDKYTADAPTLGMSNQFQKAEENKEFVSLFFSKPFGAEQQGRWNNITIFEDTNGYWNRFDVEYGFTDQLIGTAELNSYWGNEDSWFGQLKNTSNVQLGVKYIFN